jgi:hypothetical protein
LKKLGSRELMGIYKILLTIALEPNVSKIKILVAP